MLFFHGTVVDTGVSVTGHQTSPETAPVKVGQHKACFQKCHRLSNANMWPTTKRNKSIRMPFGGSFGEMPIRIISLGIIPVIRIVVNRVVVYQGNAILLQRCLGEESTTRRNHSRAADSNWAQAQRFEDDAAQVRKMIHLLEGERRRSVLLLLAGTWRVKHLVDLLQEFLLNIWIRSDVVEAICHGMCGGVGSGKHKGPQVVDQLLSGDLVLNQGVDEDSEHVGSVALRLIQSGLDLVVEEGANTAQRRTETELCKRTGEWAQRVGKHAPCLGDDLSEQGQVFILDRLGLRLILVQVVEGVVHGGETDHRSGELHELGIHADHARRWSHHWGGRRRRRC
mmetsp:Transcript_2132/g.6724  ORF Transcript_2132/g.6724 Transcript_2132/m.6724 type:complete len:339 (+) Transcript_2132:167-1183(+)